MLLSIGKASVETKGTSTQAYKENASVECSATSNRRAFIQGQVNVLCS